MNYLSYIKLKTGEHLAAFTDVETFVGVQKVLLVKPVLLKLQRTQNESGNIVEGVLLSPWLKLTHDDIYEIASDSIMIIGELNKHLGEEYLRLIGELELGEQDGIVDDIVDDEDNEADAVKTKKDKTLH